MTGADGAHRDDETVNKFYSVPLVEDTYLSHPVILVNRKALSI
jgi:hypothetical protein